MFKEVESVIANTTMEAYYSDKTNELLSYKITPKAEYKLHHSALDTEIFDEVTHEATGKVEMGYTDSFIILHKSYDFEENPFDIYAINRNEVE